MYDDGDYRCDKCGRVIKESVPTVLDTNDYAQNIADLEGVELCIHCYCEFMAEQEKVLSKFRASLQFDWHKDDEDTYTFADWLHDDITWCRRECPKVECFRNKVNRRQKVGLFSVSDMYEEGKCPKEAR